MVYKLNLNEAVIKISYENLCPHKDLHMDVYSSFIHNCQNMEATKMPFSKWMDIAVHPDNGILFSAKKKWAIKPWKDMKET